MEGLIGFLGLVFAIIVCVCIVGTYERAHSINKKMDSIIEVAKSIEERLYSILQELRRNHK
jgi:hypothetical protein